MMSGRFGDLCILSGSGAMPYEGREHLLENIVRIADFFGFRSLPDELKLAIHICGGAEFKRKKEESGVNIPDHAAALTCGVNQIFVLAYRAVSSAYSRNAYDAMIVHECVHAFQAYFSMAPPGQYVWLYESVACYLAGQIKPYNEKNRVSWEVFTNDFYGIHDCYGLAYQFGNEIFARFGDEIRRVIQTPGAYLDRLAKVYELKF